MFKNKFPDFLFYNVEPALIQSVAPIFVSQMYFNSGKLITLQGASVLFVFTFMSLSWNARPEPSWQGGKQGSFSVSCSRTHQTDYMICSTLAAALTLHTSFTLQYSDDRNKVIKDNGVVRLLCAAVNIRRLHADPAVWKRCSNDGK